ncbi:silent information regulator family protein [Pelomyxa schiedti]|nr:silent information regulator family protein [Pelomyxa schiedti]
MLLFFPSAQLTPFSRSRNKGLVIRIKGVEHTIPDADYPQITTRSEDTLTTEKTVWDGAGYPTTETLKEKADRKLQENLQILEDNLSGKSSKTTTLGKGAGPYAEVQKRLVPYASESGDVLIVETLSNDVILIENNTDANFYVLQNQRLSSLLCINCKNCKISALDSAVIASRTCRLIDCDNCTFIFEDVDVRKVECFRTTNCSIIFIGDEVVLENSRVIWREGCQNNTVNQGVMTVTTSAVRTQHRLTRSIPVPPTTINCQLCTTLYPVQHMHNLNIVDKTASGTPVITEAGLSLITELTPFTMNSLPGDERWNSSIPTAEDILQSLATLREAPFTLTKKDLRDIYDTERMEYEEPLEVVAEKAKEIALMMKAAKHCVLYSGAGISTSGGIPDFRGPQGVWTLRDKGLHVGGKDICGASPTLAHYAVTELARKLLIRFVITTNMDGLHLRSGLPNHLLVELHGCCYKEWCSGCGKYFMRAYDVAEGTNTREHWTKRRCNFCNTQLQDTIVHFSETYRSQMDPMTAMYHSRTADLAIVMGTSMCVQGAASYPDKVLKNPGGKMVIVNLQNTPYDKLAAVRVFARTDTFMKALLTALEITEFDQQTDCIQQWDENMS